jgi:hypothetical protein
MKGQFFIISTVIVISALVLITQYLYDFGRIDLTRLFEIRETDYIRYVKDSLLITANTTYLLVGCDAARIDAELLATKVYLADRLIRKGIVLDVDWEIEDCTVSFSFNLTSPGFRSQTWFSWP